MNKPQISVVMSVYNGEKYLRQSIESILIQKNVNFEFIIVNDGSTDDSGSILNKYARQDNRIKIIEQDNKGLTQSLINACNVANGEFIARQDVGDKSLGSRLKRQFDYLNSNKDITLVSCFAVYRGPYNIELFRVTRKDTPKKATEFLKHPDVSKIQGISHHGTAMFSKKDYISVGGYRNNFYFAQDLDLWLRLTDIGLLGFVQEFLYEAKISASSVSSKYRKKQIQLANIAIQLSKLRKMKKDESLLLQKASLVKPSLHESFHLEKVKLIYFILSCIWKRINRRGNLFIILHFIDKYF